MAKCINCNVEILDETQVCPLCCMVLENGEEMENMYPQLRLRQRRLLLASRIYLFSAICVEALLVLLSLYSGWGMFLSLLCAMVMLYAYLVLRYAVIGRSNNKSKVAVLGAIAVLLTIAADFAAGYRGWSVDYVLPGAVLLADAAIVTFMFIDRRGWHSYIMWQLLAILVSVIPAGLFLCGLEKNAFMAFAPLAVSLAVFAGTMIIGDRRARMELVRRFHI